MYVYKYLDIKKCVFMSGGGAEWNGVEWNGVERNGMEWIGMKRIGNLFLEVYLELHRARRGARRGDG